MGGLLRYLVGPGLANEHVEPHLVFADPVVAAQWGGGVLSLADAVGIARVLDGPRRSFGVPEVTADGTPFQHVWHCSWSVAAVEGRLPDETWGAIAGDVMDGMGFSGAGGKAPCRAVAVHHGPSAGQGGQPGNDHMHLAVSLVREDGTKASVWNDRPRVQRLAAELERRYGLVVVESRVSGRGSRSVSRGEWARMARSGRPEPDRVSLGRAVRGAAAAAGSEAEFVARLRAGGMLVKPWPDRRGRAEPVTGFAVAARPGRGEVAVFFGGGHLAKDLSLPRLRAAQGWSDAPDAVAVWRSGGRGRPVPPVAVDPGLLASYAREVGAVREWLRTVDPADVAVWGAVAGQVGGVFAAWSVAVEGDRPGPLARAAQVVSRSAELPAWRARQVPAGVVPAWSRGVAQVAVGGRGAVGQALLLRQVMNVAKALHDAHAAVGEAARASEIERVARGELAAVVASAGALLEVPVAVHTAPDPGPRPPGPGRGSVRARRPAAQVRVGQGVER